MNTKIAQSPTRQWISIFSIIFAGEIIFSLPFHLARFFRPTFLNSFELTNTELGDIFAFYGLVAMLAYFPGGYLADRFSARKLMSFALIATGIGGLYLSSFPSTTNLKLLFAYWGLTTILFFWSAMIKLTRDVASHDNQGKAFGLLEGGRGLVAASLASIGVWLLSIVLPDSIASLTGEQRLVAMRLIIYYYTALTLLAGIIIWSIIVDVEQTNPKDQVVLPIRDSLSSLSNPLVWYQAAIVFCAYCGFKGLDYFGLYLVNIYDYSEIESSQLIANSSFIRPIAAIAAGILADKWLPSKLLGYSFMLACVSYALFLLLNSSTSPTFLMGNVLFCFVLIFALRAVYFALIEQAQVARNMTGISVGIISVIGFTPDVFFAPLAGRLLDNPDTLVGFQHFFISLMFIAFCGAIVTYLLARRIRTHDRTN